MWVLTDSKMLPQQNADDSHQSKNGAKHQTRWQLSERDPPPVAQLYFSERERADDQRRRLRSRVSARADDERDEQREHHCLLQLALKVSHRRRRQHLAQKERSQP